MTGMAESASRRIRSSLDALVDDVLDRQWSRWPGMKERFSEFQLRQTADDTRYHLEFIASALWFEERALLDDYLIWCKVLFENLNLPDEWIEGSIDCVVQTLDNALPDPEAALVRSYVEGSLSEFRRASAETSSFILPAAPLGELAQGYLKAVLAGERFAAVQMLVDTVDAGTSVRDIYLRVFQPTQREIGRLWLLNEVSVAQEHYATAVTQVAMARLYEHVFTGQDFDRTLVAACVGGELHELGARMVADFFEMDHWNTHYLGANSPSAAILEAVRESKADALALSATMAFHVEEVAEIIELVRADVTISGTRVLVGGYPFNVVPELWRRVGADGYAPSAETAPQVAAKLTTA
jgi:methanogenic corrinoid protein MtbC1